MEESAREGVIEINHYDISTRKMVCGKCKTIDDAVAVYTDDILAEVADVGERTFAHGH